jgi:hypothetical protein
MTMADTPLSRAPATRERLLHDARAVLDVSEFDATRLGRGPWVVLRATPEPHSGSATSAGSIVDGDTGELVHLSGALPGPLGYSVLVYEGSYEILSVLSGQPPPASGRYLWSEQQEAVVREVSRDHLYQPFAQGGVVVCQFDPAARERPPFQRVSLLPEGWEQYVPRAARTAADPSADTLSRRLRSRNPLLFTQAIRALADRGYFDKPTLRSTLERADGYQRAVSYFALLRDGRYPDVLEASLAADFAPGSEADQRRAAALALFTGQLLAPQAVASVTGEAPLRREGGLLEAAMTAGDPYVREAVTVLTPA